MHPTLELKLPKTAQFNCIVIKQKRDSSSVLENVISFCSYTPECILDYEVRQLEMTEPPSTPLHMESNSKSYSSYLQSTFPLLQPHCLNSTLIISKLEYSNSLLMYHPFSPANIIYPVTRMLFLKCKIEFVTLLFRDHSHLPNTFRYCIQYLQDKV